MHETRYLGIDAPTLTGGSTYYGSVDATPLFVVLLGELSRWGSARTPCASWCRTPIGRWRGWASTATATATGTSSTQKTSDRGWSTRVGRTRTTAIRYRDGRVAEAPLALCEVQGYAYAAHRRAVPRSPHGSATPESATAALDAGGRAEGRASTATSGCDEHGWFAVALGPDKEPVDSLTSNIGHCLWSGIVDDDRAE